MLRICFLFVWLIHIIVDLLIESGLMKCSYIGMIAVPCRKFNSVQHRRAVKVLLKCWNCSCWFTNLPFPLSVLIGFEQKSTEKIAFLPKFTVYWWWVTAFVNLYNVFILPEFIFGEIVILCLSFSCFHSWIFAALSTPDIPWSKGKADG